MTNFHKSWSRAFGVGFGFLASALVPHKAWALDFSGFQWVVKNGNDSVLGPGPNRFRKENVFVDSEGRLHMLIRRDADGVWSCSEIIMRRNIGYGRHTIWLDTPVDSLHPQSVLGFFTWSDRLPNNEIDIEIARFRGNDGPNLFFSVQPNTQDFSVSGLAWAQSEHTVVWSRGIVNFSSTARGRGSATVKPITASIRRDVPRPTSTTFPRINFWLRDGVPPQGVSTGELEVIISAVEIQRQ